MVKEYQTYFIMQFNMGKNLNLGKTSFNIVTQNSFRKLDIINMGLLPNDMIVIKDSIKVENGYRTKLDMELIVIHNCFLYKYSQYLHFRM